MNRLPRSFGAIFCAYLAVIAAGLNFYATVDDSSLVPAMRNHLGLSATWNVVAFGSIIALLGAIAMLAPLVAGALRYALSAKRLDILMRLLAAPLAAGVLAAWVIGGAIVLGGHWAPLPWAIIGDWTASAGWPPLQERWILGSLTAALTVLLLILSSTAVYQAIQRTQYDEMRITILHRLLVFHPLRIARIPGLVTAAAMSMMTAGILTWGLLASLHATAAFHAYFGPLHTTAFVSWIGSLCVFAASSIIALRTFPSLLTPTAL